MNKRIVGALLLLVLGIAAIVSVKFLLPRIQERQQRATSDARDTKGKIVLALDNWIGYFPLRSPEMVRSMRRAGWLLAIEDDRADYQQRMKRLRSGEIDFAVATLDSYILNGASFNYPGAIIAVLDESKGGDAIVARQDAVPSLDALKGASDLRVAFTPNSPSHYLAKAAAYHFNVPQLLPVPGPYRIETRGSDQALAQLLAGKTDIAVIWEPDVTRALSQPGTVKILGTEDTTKLIVDILVVGRKFSEKHPEAVKTLLATYFTVLKKYADHPDMLHKHLMEETGLPEVTVAPMLKGVRWVNLTENCEKWFAIAGPGAYGEEGLATAIDSTLNVLMNAGDFKTNPIPDSDPRRLTYSAYVEDLCVKGVHGFTTAKPLAGSAPAMEGSSAFPPLDRDGWNRLKEVGSLKVAPIIFQHGGAELDLLAKHVVDQAVELLKHYPKFRVVVRGHTGTAGDADENMRLSQERAAAVARYLEVTHTIDPNRLLAVGLGGEAPLPRQPEETWRAWQYRLPRVELVLVRDEF
jgi:outer membrane protein OmpA-like peptidoglycan-associated protein/ABC-type taurine transport system substrate-binding protein